MVFDVKINIPKGVLFCIRIKRSDANEVAMDAIDGNETKLLLSRTDIKTAHDRLGHMGEEETRRACKHLGIELVRGGLKLCDDCAVTKAKQKAVPK